MLKKKNIEKRYREDDDYDDSRETNALINELDMVLEKNRKFMLKEPKKKRSKVFKMLKRFKRSKKLQQQRIPYIINLFKIIL